MIPELRHRLFDGVEILADVADLFVRRATRDSCVRHLAHPGVAAVGDVDGGPFLGEVVEELASGLLIFVGGGPALAAGLGFVLAGAAGAAGLAAAVDLALGSTTTPVRASLVSLVFSMKPDLVPAEAVLDPPTAFSTVLPTAAILPRTPDGGLDAMSRPPLWFGATSRLFQGVVSRSTTQASACGGVDAR
jgi:hypothetical protein